MCVSDGGRYWRGTCSSPSPHSRTHTVASLRPVASVPPPTSCYVYDAMLCTQAPRTPSPAKPSPADGKGTTTPSPPHAAPHGHLADASGGASSVPPPSAFPAPATSDDDAVAVHVGDGGTGAPVVGRDGGSPQRFSPSPARPKTASPSPHSAKGGGSPGPGTGAGGAAGTHSPSPRPLSPAERVAIATALQQQAREGAGSGDGDGDDEEELPLPDGTPARPTAAARAGGEEGPASGAAPMSSGPSRRRSCPFVNPLDDTLIPSYVGHTMLSGWGGVCPVLGGGCCRQLLIGGVHHACVG